MIAIEKSLQEIEWLGMRFPVPPDWEIVRHSVHPEKGRLTFVDHRHQRLLLNWSACEKAPDTRQLFKDYRARELERNPETVFHDLPRKIRWSGFRRISDGEVLSRAGRYDARLKRWIELTFSWPEGFDHELENVILREFETVSGDDGLSCWRAFGIKVQAPAPFVLQHVDARPGDLCLTFRHGRSETKVRRIGMAENWFDGDLENFLRKQQAGKNAPVTLRDYRGNQACSCTTTEAGRKLDRLTGRSRKREDIAWHCADAGAVFQITVIHPRKVQASPDEWIVQNHGSSAPDEAHEKLHHAGETEGSAHHAEPVPPGRLNGAEMLDATPVRNVSVRAERNRAGELILRVPLDRRWYMRPPFSWLMPFSRERTVVLDRVGETVWQSCDGTQNIDQVVKAFAIRHRVSFHEARLGVMEFLRSLTRRGFIAVALSGAEEEE